MNSFRGALMAEKKEQKEKKSFSWTPWFVITILVLIGVFLYFQFQPTVLKQDDLGMSKTVIAKVNGQPLYQEDLDADYAQIPAELQAVYPKSVLLNMTIVESLLITEAEKQGITVSDADIEQALEEAATALGSTQEAFFQELQTRGITEQEAREKLRKKMLIAQLYEKIIAEQIVVNEDEAKAYYNTHQEDFTLKDELLRISHILVETEEEAKKTLTDLRASPNLPQDFAQTAAEHSLDTASALAGGDLNSAGRGVFVPEFEEAAFSLNIGDISEPVKTQFGYHLLYLTDKKQPGLVSFEEIKESLLAQLQAQKEQETITAYVDQLMSTADIELMLKE